MSAVVSYITSFDGYPLQAYLLENIDVIGYIASFYLVMVGKGDRILRWWNNKSGAKHASSPATSLNGDKNGKLNGAAKATAASLATCYTLASLYHAFVCFACAALSCLLVPAMAQSVLSHSFFDTMCIWEDSRIYTGYVGFALSAAVLLKVLEMLDTFFLVLRDYLVDSAELEKQQPRRLTSSHWWFQVLVPLYFWHTYSVGVSCFTMLATYTVVLSALRNFVYLQQDMAQARGKTAAAMKAANVAAMVDLAECVGCSALSIYASYMNYTDERGCMTVQANARMALVMYVTEMVLRLREMKAAAGSSVSDKKKKQ